jgi:UTP--glucose-1-phosphate uridylyltransferase
VDGDAFAVLLGDTIAKSNVPCTQQLVDIYNKYGASTIAIEKVPDKKVERYGIIKGNKVSENLYEIEDLVEKPKLSEAPSNLAITGRYILTPEIFDHIEHLTPGVGGEIQLTDAMKSLDKIYGHVFEGKIYDIGNTVEWLKSSIEIALEDPEVGEDLRSYMAEIVKC